MRDWRGDESGMVEREREDMGYQERDLKGMRWDERFEREWMWDKREKYMGGMGYYQKF